MPIRKCLYVVILPSGIQIVSLKQVFLQMSIIQGSDLWILILIHPNALLLSESLMILVPSGERLSNLTTMNYIYSHLHSMGC